MWMFWIVILSQWQIGLFQCPDICTCNRIDAVNCSNNNLKKLPANINPEVRVLDLSYNDFMTIPANISVFRRLETLRLRHNRINALGNDSLQGLKELKELDLSQNGFTRWSNIYYDFLIAAESLLNIDLSHNTLKGFPQLRSNSLEELILINCSIKTLSNERSTILKDLPNLKLLKLDGNSFNEFSPIISEKLETLFLTNCNIEVFYMNALAEMPSLQYLYLSKNYKLKTFNVQSNSLKHLDLSNCDLESIPSISLNNLSFIDLSGNDLRKLEANTFDSMPNIKFINLSQNAIQDVDKDTFRSLKRVQVIDLSYNTIVNLHPNSFTTNAKLNRLYLSYNYFYELIKFNTSSLKYLDMSECEISSITSNSVRNMPSLTQLNLSRNMLITTFPSHFEAKNLLVLDLSMCRITSMKNETFINTPNLETLNLEGNRLSELNVKAIQNIRRIKLNDNAWRCECKSYTFKNLYDFLQTIESDLRKLTCQSPELFEGKHWIEACREMWYKTANTQNVAWIYSIIFIIFISMAFCVFISLNKARKRKDRLREEEQRQEMLNENRERLRRMIQMEAAMGENANAPDPRETERPPSYVEAISMPSLSGSCGSINQKASNKSGKKSKQKPRRKRRKSKSSSNNDEQQSNSRLNDSGSPASAVESDV